MLGTVRKNGMQPEPKDPIVKLRAFVPVSGGDVLVLTPGHVEDYHV
jgi:hypothetical protein